MRKTINIKQHNILLYISCFLVFFLYCSHSSFAQIKPVADVNGVVLTEYDLQISLNEIMPAGVFHGGFSSEKRASYRPKAVEKMIDKELLYQEALKRGMKADTEAINNSREKMINKIGSLEKYKQALEQSGMTDEQYIRNLEKNQMADEIFRIEVDSKAQVTDKEALEYYTNNITGFKRPKSIKLRHILISVKPEASLQEKNKQKEKAELLLSRIKAGEDMAKIASDYSNDRYRIKGGDYGFIHMGRLDPDLEKQVMKLEINELSDIIETRFGYHIARVEGINPPTQLTYEQASDKIKIQLTESKKKSLELTFISTLRKNARIIVF